VSDQSGPRAVRLKYTGHLESVRERIQTTQIVKRLNAFALGDKDDQTGKPVEMTPTQVKAAVALLKKTVPDLTQIEMTADVTLTKHEQALNELE
jgi:hypothetical protein